MVGLTVSKGGGVSATSSTFFLTSSGIDQSGKQGLDLNGG
jgi:hypothetical protein